MSQAGTRRDRSKSSDDDDSGVPSPGNSAQSSNKSAFSPLRRIVFIQKVALFAGATPKKALQLIYVTPEWRETVLDFTFDALFFEPFVKPLLQQTSSTSLTEKEKEMQQQNEKKKLELFQQFRKVVAFVFERDSAENKELDFRMKTFLAVLFNFVHRKHNNNDDDNNNNNSNDDDSSYVANAGFHKEVASFLDEDSLRSFLRIEDLHDLIINHIAPRVTAIEQFGRLICFVQEQQSAELFSNIESFSTILKCFHRSKTSADANWIASSVERILLCNPSSNILLNSLPVVEAFSFIIPLAKDGEAVECILESLLKILKSNGEAQQKFTTPSFFQILKGMEKHETSIFSQAPFEYVLGFVNPTDFLKPLVDATTSSQLKSAVDAVPRHEKYLTSQVRDVLISKKDLIVDSGTADSVVTFLESFSAEESRVPLLRTKAIQDLIINHIAPHVTAIYELGSLICSIVQEQQSADFFTNVESFSAILKCFHRSKTSNEACWIAGSISNIIKYNPSSNKLLNSLPVVEAFSFIIPLVDDDDTVYLISSDLMKIFKNNEGAQKKFGTPEFLEIFKGMENYALRDESKTAFQSVADIFVIFED
jgi:hypothetical protein